MLSAIPGVEQIEMKRCKERGFCCGAGGARMWLEENIGKRINMERTDEALGTGADVVSTACPYCMIMLDDAVRANDKQDDVRVLDLSQLVEESLNGGPVAAGPADSGRFAGLSSAGGPGRRASARRSTRRPLGAQREGEPLVGDHGRPVLVPVRVGTRARLVVTDQRLDRGVLRVGRHR